MADKTEIILTRQDLVGLVNVRTVFFIDIDVSLARILGNAEADPEGHLSPCQIWWVWTSPAAGAARNVEFLFVSLCVRHVCLHVTICRRTLGSAVVVSA